MTERERFALINGTALGWLLAIIALLLNFHVGHIAGVCLAVLGIAAAYLSEIAVARRIDAAMADLVAIFCIILVILSYAYWLVRALAA